MPPVFEAICTYRSSVACTAPWLHTCKGPQANSEHVLMGFQKSLLVERTWRVRIRFVSTLKTRRTIIGCYFRALFRTFTAPLQPNQTHIQLFDGSGWALSSLKRTLPACVFVSAWPRGIGFHSRVGETPWASLLAKRAAIETP